MRTKGLFTAVVLGLGLTLALVWLLGGGRLSVARAASLTVDVTYDENDGSCTDGDCSLRDAVIIANTSGGADVITLESGTYALSLTGAGEDAAATGDLDVAGVLTIVGAGPDQTIIDAGGLVCDRAFDVRPGAGTVVISGVTIMNGNVNGFGGGIYNDDADLALINTVVSSNVATGTYLSGGGNGGGVYVEDGSLAVTGGRIVSNTATRQGGGLHVLRARATLTGTEIVSNTAANGGGMYLPSGSATLSGVQVLSNSAPYGGGVYFYDGTATLEGGQVRGNTAGRYGGGVYVANASTTLAGTQIVSNTAGEHGGGVWISAGTVALEGGEILGNTAGREGGGVYMSDSGATFTQTAGSAIAFNTAIGTAYGSLGGGGVCVRRGRAMLAGTILSNTTGADGGAVCVYKGSVTLTGNQVVSNTASRGGGVYVFDGEATLEGVQVLGNVAIWYGGGLYVLDGSATLTGTQILGNTARDFGGGMVLGLGSATLSRVSVADNTAWTGGGIFNSDGTLTLANVTVSGNTATAGNGGGLHGHHGTSVLTYTTVASNTATGNGGGITSAEGGTVLLRNTIVARNGPANCDSALTSNGHNLDSGATCGFTATGDITNTDPLLRPLSEESGTWVHALPYNSPAVDEGVCLAEPTVDQRGVLRPQGTACDIGAYEFLAVAPTGVTIDGPTEGFVGQSYTFTATVSPPTVTLPVTYTWSPAPDVGQGTDVATYNWITAGKRTITVTVENRFGATPTPGTHDFDVANYKVYLPLLLNN